MKNLLLKPGLETVFALSLIVILGLPPVLMAQNEKDLEIKIVNGDTTVNGTNIKELSPKDRKYALRDIRNLSGQPAPKIIKDFPTDSVKHTYFFKRRDSLGGITQLEFRRGNDVPNRVITRDRFFDSGPNRLNRKNSQSFDYVNTDGEGISTHLRFYISEVSNEDLKKMPHVEGGKFELENLNIVPEFTSGQILLMFNLPAKTVANVKLINSDRQIIWDEKAEGGHFSKTFGLGLNGIYFLQIRQGNFVSVKRIIKEE